MTVQSAFQARGQSARAPFTKAERGLVAQFAEAAATLPGGGWVAKVRADAMAAFEASGLPSRRVEAFKYTDLRERLKDAYPPVVSAPAPVAVTRATIDAALGPLAAAAPHRFVFVDGHFSPELSILDGLKPFAESMPLGPLLKKAPVWLEGKFTADRLGQPDAVKQLNTAFMADGLMLKIKPELAADAPILLVCARSAAAPATNTMRHIIAMEKDTSATLIEAHVVLEGAAAEGSVNSLTDVTLADGARLDHVKWTCQGNAASHLGSLVANIGAGAEYRAFQLTAGTGLVRNGLDVKLAGEGSRLDISGAFIGRGTEHIDTTLVVDHAVPGCESRELFKGVLDDRARGVFQGRIIVRPGADKTDGKQMAKALMLSQEAEFDTKPELEIYADDVACGHGATCAELDEGLLFYCMSRGIPEAHARALLIEAFIGEAIEKVEPEAVRSALSDAARPWLQGGRS